jgi:hypothetical protein
MIASPPLNEMPASNYCQSLVRKDIDFCSAQEPLLHISKLFYWVDS